jgi:glyoxylase-like metal-dependent hydrolase (beta-lactamase superfamily II)
MKRIEAGQLLALLAKLRAIVVIACLSSVQITRAQSTDELFDERPLVDLIAVDWMHGVQDCDAELLETSYVEWQRVQYQADTYIFRQNKCSNYEAPFVYLFVGSERALLIDTGATVNGGSDLVMAIRAITDLPVVAAHSHGHADHTRGDGALRAADGVAVVGIGPDAVRSFFELESWPQNPVTLDLGNRNIELLPIPGHSDDDLAFYDPVSKFVVAGDTLYPGRLYIADWSAYRASIARLARWVEDKEVSYVMGTHIEMSSAPNVDYPIGTTYQPEEHQLPLGISDITKLAEAAAQMETPERTYLGSFIVWPND